MRYVKYRWLLFAAAFVCIVILCAALLIKPSRNTLTDIAAELEVGQLVCEDGTIWQISADLEDGNMIEAKRIGEIEPETIIHEFDDEVDGAVGAVECAQRMKDYGDVWVDSDGGVWSRNDSMWKVPHNEIGDTVTLEQLFTLTEEEAEVAAELQLEMKKHSLNFTVPLTGEEDYSDLCYTLSLLLEDGWQVVDKGEVNYRKYSVQTGTAVYTFNNANTTTYPVYEDRYYCSGSLNSSECIKNVPGSYCLKVYATQGEKRILIAEHNMTTEINGHTLHIS